MIMCPKQQWYIRPIQLNPRQNQVRAHGRPDERDWSFILMTSPRGTVRGEKRKRDTSDVALTVRQGETVQRVESI